MIRAGELGLRSQLNDLPLCAGRRPVQGTAQANLDLIKLDQDESF
jgi:hypothetical protein